MDNLTKEQRRKNMRNIRSRDTLPERMIEKALKARKIYFAKNVKSILGKPDFVFRKKKILVFVDSDFWHGHPMRGVMPKSNRVYWTNKIQGNRLRDKKIRRTLKAQGWHVIRIWEYDIKMNFQKTLRKMMSPLTIAS